jgi:hypothetical protein
VGDFPLQKCTSGAGSVSDAKGVVVVVSSIHRANMWACLL